MIFDGHSDILTDLTIQYANGEKNPFGERHKDDLKNGNVKGGIFVIWPEPPNDKRSYERTKEILTSLESEIHKGNIKLARTYSELIDSWNTEEFTVLLGAEGLSSIEDKPYFLDELYERGLRHCSLTWNETNKLATGVTGDSERGLTVLGEKTVRKIENMGILLDVSHLNEKSFWDIAKIVRRPLIASHSNLRSICDHPRNISDDQIRFIKETGGLIGINSYKEFVSEDPLHQTIDGFVRHIIEASNLVGIDHVSLGFDYFGYLEAETIESFSCESPSVTGLENTSKSQQVIVKLQDLGLRQDEIEKLCYKNYFRVIKDVIG